MVSARLMLGVVLLATACNENVLIIRPVIDGPEPGSSAAAFPDLDTIEMSVALAGKPQPLVSKLFRRGEDLDLPGVPYGEDLVIHMIGRVNNIEVAVGRTCPFSVRTDEDPPSPHLYFARTVKWAEFSTPSSDGSGAEGVSYRRDGATALTDFEGNALFIGGVDETAAPISSIDRFNTMEGRFEEVAFVEPRFNGAAALLGDGRIVIGGGTGQNGLPSDKLEVISLQLAPDRRVERVNNSQLVGSSAPAMVTLSDGRVVAFGGEVDGTPSNKLVEISAVGGFIEERVLQRAKLAIPRKGHTATRLTDDLGAPVLVIGGLDAAGEPIALAELYKPLLEEMAPAAQFAPTMITPRRDHEAVLLPDGSVLVVGGLDVNSQPVRDLEIFTFDSGFQPAGILPDTAGVIDFTITPLPDGSILLAGGRDENNMPVATSFIIRLDPSDGDLDVVTTDRLTTARARHQATLLCDGTVILVGGTLIDAPAERYNPPSTGRR